MGKGEGKKRDSVRLVFYRSGVGVTMTYNYVGLI